MDNAPNKVEELFLKLMETSVMNIQELNGNINLLLRQQDEFNHKIEYLQRGLEELSNEIHGFRGETYQNFSQVKDELNLFTRRIDFINRDIVAVRANQADVNERIKNLKETSE